MNFWIDIGTIQVSNVWQTFSISLISPVVIRLTYTTDWVNWANNSHRRSYGMIRLVYPDILESVSPANRIYPKEESEIRTFSDVLYSNTFSIQVKRFNYYRSYNVLEPFNWALKIEYEQSES